MLKTAHIFIFGQVQGVGFRYGVFSKAKSLRLNGWVKNNADLTVEILAEGNDKDLKKIIEWCYNGVKGAKVEKIETEWKKYRGDFDNFLIL